MISDSDCDQTYRATPLAADISRWLKPKKLSLKISLTCLTDTKSFITAFSFKRRLQLTVIHVASPIPPAGHSIFGADSINYGCRFG